MSRKMLFVRSAERTNSIFLDILGKPPQFIFMPQRTSGWEEIETDVLIIGGGLVGSTLAATLTKTPLKVCVIDHANPEGALRARFDGRASAVSLSNQKLLEGVGLWELLKDSSAPILDIRARISRIGADESFNNSHKPTPSRSF